MAIKKTSVLPAVLFLIGLGLLVGWLGGASHGQAVRSAGKAVTRFQLAGNYQVRMSFPEPSGVSPDKDFNDVRRITVLDEWVELVVREDKDEATLLVPRDKIVYIKAWRVKEPEEE